MEDAEVTAYRTKGRLETLISKLSQPQLLIKVLIHLIIIAVAGGGIFYLYQGWSMWEYYFNTPKQQWGNLINEQQTAYVLKGTITDLKDTERGGIVGKAITLEKDDRKAQFFIDRIATIYEGSDILDARGWQAISPDDLSIGDVLEARITLGITSEKNKLLFRAHWAFRYK